MVLIGADVHVYNDLKRLRGARLPALTILVAPNPDAIAASYILTLILKREDVPYVLRPTKGYEDLCEIAVEEMAKEETRALFLINCGAMVDLGRLLELNETNVQVFVLDSHRPYNLRNIYHKQVWLIDDGTTAGSDLPRLEDMLDDPAFEEESDEDYEDDDEEEQYRRNDYEDDSGMSEERERDREYKRKMSNRKRIARQISKQPRTQVEKEYYEQETKDGLSYGASVAGLLLEMSSQVYQNGVDLRFYWPAIIGLTDQWLHGRIDDAKYKFEVEVHQNEIQKYNVSKIREAQAVRAQSEKINNENYAVDFNVLPPNFRYTNDSSVLEQVTCTDDFKRAIRTSGHAHVEISSEYRFMLYRHWSLYDSMWHSQYIATRLGIWKENGQKRLDVLLARMGVPLSQAKENWNCMDNTIREQFQNNVQQAAAQFGLTETCYPSFVLQKGFKSKISAADHVYTISSLLEGADGWAEDEKEEKEEDKKWVSNFWRAFDSLSLRQDDAYDLLQQRGIELAINLQRAIVRQAADVVEKRCITHCGPIRYTMLHQTPDLNYFIHPLALRKLALFLVEYVNERKTKAKPFLVCAKNEKKGTYLIVGAVGTEQEFNSSQKEKNFGRSFREAASRTGARIAHFGFDSSVVEVMADDIHKFIEYIQWRMKGKIQH